MQKLRSKLPIHGRKHKREREAYTMYEEMFCTECFAKVKEPRNANF